MSAKYNAPEFAALHTKSAVRLDARLRSGAGKHDSRTNRQRTRSDARRAAIRDHS